MSLQEYLDCCRCRRIRSLGKGADTETSLAPAAALATACGVGQRSRSLEKKFVGSNFRSSYFRIRDGAYEIYEN